MTITNEPIMPGKPVKFTVKGWPDEDSVKSAVERFYGLKPEAEKNFIVHNIFDELIMSGNILDGKVASFNHHDRSEKPQVHIEAGDK